MPIDLKLLTEASPLVLALIILFFVVYIVYKLIITSKRTREQEDNTPPKFSQAWMERVERRLKEYHELNNKINEIFLSQHNMKAQMSRIEDEFRDHITLTGDFREEMGTIKADLKNISEQNRRILEKLNIL